MRAFVLFSLVLALAGCPPAAPPNPDKLNIPTNPEGASPGAGLIRSVNDGNFYGTAFGGGDNGYGTVFRMTPPLAFPSKQNQPLATVITSAPIKLAAIANASSGTITISNGEYSVNGGAFTSAPGTVHTDDEVVIRTTSAATYNTRVLAAYSIGTANGAFAVTTVAAP